MNRATLQVIALSASAGAAIALLLGRLPGAGDALILVGGFTAAVTGVIYRAFQAKEPMGKRADEHASNGGVLGRGAIGGPGSPSTLIAAVLLLQAVIIILSLLGQPGDQRVWVLLPLFAVHDLVIMLAVKRRTS